MKTIFSDLKNGSATVRLAIASDLISITGISLAAILTPIFAYRGQVDVDALAGQSIVLLFGLAAMSLFLAGVVAAHSWLKSAIAGLASGWLLLAALWLMSLAIFFYGSYCIYSALAYTHW